MKKGFLFMLLVAVVFLSIPIAGWADCPDRMNCYYVISGYEATYVKVGTVDIPTCWKFGTGCKPWHCSGGNYKTEEQCKAICVEKFPVLKDKKIISVEFPLF